MITENYIQINTNGPSFETLGRKANTPENIETMKARMDQLEKANPRHQFQIVAIQTTTEVLASTPNNIVPFPPSTKQIT